MRSKRINVELGSGFLFDISEEVDGFWVNYGSEWFEGWKPSRSDLRWLVRRIKKIMKDIGVQTPHFALYLVLFGALGESNLTCCVDKRKQVIYLRLPIYVIRRRLGVPTEDHEDYVFYHELMHAKDCLEGRFPSSGFISINQNPELALITSLWHFSIEGRLEKTGKPHKSRPKVIEDEYLWARNLKLNKTLKPITKEIVRELCDQLWGREVTFEELQSLLKINHLSSQCSSASLGRAS